MVEAKTPDSTTTNSNAINEPDERRFGPDANQNERERWKKQLYTFNDIRLYDRAMFKGCEGHVVEKGPDVSERATGRHIRIQLFEGCDSVRSGRNIILHERLVNMHLRKQETLWVGIDGHLDPHDPRE